VQDDRGAWICPVCGTQAPCEAGSEIDAKFDRLHGEFIELGRKAMS
jgi:hypothetical protein